MTMTEVERLRAKIAELEAELAQREKDVVGLQTALGNLRSAYLELVWKARAAGVKVPLPITDCEGT